MSPRMSTTKHDWREDPVGPKQVYWIRRSLDEHKPGIALRDQATELLARYAEDPESVTKGEASDLLDRLFKAPKAEVHYVGQGVYRHEDRVYVVRPNQKYIEDPTQKGAGLYSMSLVEAPQAEGVRLVLVFDPEARASLAEDEQVTLDDITPLLAKCMPSARKVLKAYALAA